MRSKWDILEGRRWGGWNWLTCSQREGNIKQTPQPTLVVADSPKKGKNQYGAIKAFLWAAAIGLSFDTDSWQGSVLSFYFTWMSVCVCGRERKYLHLSLSQWIRVGPRWICFKANRFYKWWTRNNNRLTKHTASLVGGTTHVRQFVAPGCPGNGQNLPFFSNTKSQWHWQLTLHVCS